MYSFKEFLLEMSYQDALSALGLSAGFSADELKAAYKKAAIANHPDRGGSEEMMKKVNAANDMLKKRVGTGTSTSMGSGPVSNFDKKAYQAWKDINIPRIYKQMRDNFDTDAYKNHFEKFSGKKFEVIIETPDLQRMTKSLSGHRISMNVVIQDKAQETIVKLKFSTDWMTVWMDEQSKDTLGTGSTEFAYPLSLWMEAYHNGRNQKFKQRDWQSGKNHTILTNPSELLPDTKMKKMFATGSTSGKADKPLKPADFKRTWTTKLGGSIERDTWFLGNYSGPKEERKNLQMGRMTLFKKAGYNIHYISGERPSNISTFYENQITMDMFLELGEAIKSARNQRDWITKANAIIEKYAALTKEWLNS